MSITEFAEARLLHDRTKKQSQRYEPTISMEPGQELLATKYDEVLRIMQWVIKYKMSNAGIAFHGGPDEIIQNAMVYLMRWNPSTPVTITTRVHKAVIWSVGRNSYHINRRLEAQMTQRSLPRAIAVNDPEFARVDREDLDQALWRRCARIIRSDRQHQILLRWWKYDEDQTVMATEQGVTRQMISLLMKKAEAKLREKKAELADLNELFLEGA